MRARGYSTVRMTRFLLAALVAVLLVATVGDAQSPPLGAYHALVIGNQAYRHLTPLKTPAADARAVADVLRTDYRFAGVRLLVDATRAQMVEALTDMRRRLGERDNLLIYYAGHGYLDREADRGYCLAVDAQRDSPTNWVSNADITDALRAMRAKHVLIVADSCYSGTLTRDLAVRAPEASDLAKLAQRRARSVLTSGGLEPVTDVGGGGHSVFARAFLTALRANTTATDGTSLFTGLRKQVMLSAEQTPQYGDIRLAGHDGGDFIFARPGVSVAAIPPPRPEPAITKEVLPAYGSLAIRGKLAGIEVWLGERKIGETESSSTLLVSNLAVGTYRIKARKADHKEWQREIQVAANQRTDVLIDLELLGPAKVIKGEDGAEMVLVPAGEFWMGSEQAEVDLFFPACKRRGNSDEACKQWGEPERHGHRVVLDAFYIDRFEVTNALFERFVTAAGHRTTAEARGSASVRVDHKWTQVKGAWWRAPQGPGSAVSTRHPVVQVSWHDADAYCRWAGKRLPTEAEWEKAARGTDRRRYPWGDEWDASKANGSTGGIGTGVVVIGSYPDGVSPYGAHDMAGNVAEWVADWMSLSYYEHSPERNPRGPQAGTQRVGRGGSCSIPSRAADDAPLRLDAGPRQRHPRLPLREELVATPP